MMFLAFGEMLPTILSQLNLPKDITFEKNATNEPNDQLTSGDNNDDIPGMYAK
jgi:hypothetical protein